MSVQEGTCPSVAALLARLELSTDQKTAARIRVGKTKAYPDPNAFGLPSGPEGSCGNGVTPFCRSCYAESLEKQWPAVADKMARNFETLLQCGDSHRALVDALDGMLCQWYTDTVRRGSALTFRIHWDGDFYSPAYARAWASIACAYPDVTFWCYTRRLWAPAILLDAPNIAVYASVDEYNVDAWRPVLAQLPRLKVAACAHSMDEGAALIAALGRGRAPACPEGRRLPLVVGLSGRPSDIPVAGELGRGACDACGHCLTGRGDVRFSTTKK